MLVIRLFRTGKKNQPFFKVVVTDKRNPPRGGRFVEELGFLNPLTKQKNLKTDRIKYWISVGAKPSDTLYNLLIKENILEGKKISVHKKKKVKKEDVKKEKPKEIETKETEPKAVEKEKIVSEKESSPVESVEEKEKTTVKTTENKEEIKEEIKEEVKEEIKSEAKNENKNKEEDKEKKPEEKQEEQKQ